MTSSIHREAAMNFKNYLENSKKTYATLTLTTFMSVTITYVILLIGQRARARLPRSISLDAVEVNNSLTFALLTLDF